MKTLKTILRLFIALIFVVILVVLIYVRHLSHRALPDYTELLQFSQLEDSVTIYRDDMGIPHIYATNENDLYFTTGYIMAQERLWQMDLLRRVTQGRLAEIFGEDFVDTDFLLRNLQFSKRSERILSKLTPGQKNCLESYADGINTCIEKSGKKLPFEFKLLGYQPEKWLPEHTLNLIGYMAWDLKAGWHIPALSNLQKKLDSARFASILPDESINKTVCFPDSINLSMAQNLSKIESMGLDVFCGSNTWAVSGDRSVTGKPLLANDMHLSFAIPGIWFQLHQCIPGKLNVTGLSLPGAPLIVVGHNDSIAWGMTNTYVDNLDFYEEKVNPDDTTQYEFNGEWRNFTYQKETIKTKEGKEIVKQMVLSHHGPVVSEIKGIADKTVTMHWTDDESGNEVRSIYLLNRAGNWDEFKNAMSTFVSISQNISYADVNGNIGLYACAGVPIRNRDISLGILPGNTDKYDWTGLIPFEELPHTFNPPAGEVSAANNRTISNNYPYHIGSWYSKPFRIDRIREMLTQEQKHSVESFSLMQNDSYSKMAELFLDFSLDKVNSKELREEESSAFSILQNWNKIMDKDLVAPMLFEKWAYTFTKTVTDDEMKAINDTSLFESAITFKNLFYHLVNNANSVWYDNINTPETETCEQMLTKSFKTTVSELTKDFGNDTSNWKWGIHHLLTLKHPMAKVEALDKIFHLNLGPYPVNGGFHTVSPYSFLYFKPEDVIHGASHRNIYNLANWDESYTVIPAGNSGQPASKFYDNQTGLYLDGLYHHDWFSKPAVKENAKYTQIFSPNGKE